MAQMALDAVPVSARSAGNATARKVFGGLPQHYDALAWLLSVAQDRRWRRSVVAAVAAGRASRVLDGASAPAGAALSVASHADAGVVGVAPGAAVLHLG